MIIIKDNSVQLGQLHPALALVLAGTVAPLLWQHFQADCVITSGDEQSAKHAQTSLHYCGMAVDIRIMNPINGAPMFDAILFVDRLKKHLNCDFDVILESNHIHIEFQPKRRG